MRIDTRKDSYGTWHCEIEVPDTEELSERTVCQLALVILAAKHADWHRAPFAWLESRSSQFGVMTYFFHAHYPQG